MKAPFARAAAVLCSTLIWSQIATAAAPLGPARTTLYRQIASLRDAWKTGKLKQQVTAADVATLQNWLDLFEDEGCIHPSSITGTPLEMFDAMNAINQQLAAKSPQLSATVDALMPRLDRLSNIWYADGSVGDIAGPWTPLTTATVARAEEHQVVLSAAGAGASPLEITITCFEGGKVFRIHGPAEGFYQPQTLSPEKIAVHQSGNTVTLRGGGDASLKVTLNPLRLQIVGGDDKSLWDGGDLSVFLDPTSHAIKAVKQTSQLGVDDRCLGLGERFNALDHRGHVVTNWASDSIFSAVRSKWTETYKPIPLVIDPRGVSVFYNTQTLTRLDLGATDAGNLVVTSPGNVFDDYVFVGEPLAVIGSYTKLTGRPIAVPDWALMPWMGGGVARWNINGADKSCDEVRTAVERMQKLDIPHSAIYIEGIPTDKPNGKALVAWLGTQNLKPIAWYGPNAGKTETDSFLPDQLAKLFIKDASGATFVCPPGRFLAGDYYIDFTNPLSVEMLIRRWKWHIDEGIRGCMIDGGEESPRDGSYDNGLHGDVMHNLYPLFYHRAHLAMFEDLIPGDNVCFGRSGAPGDQASMGQFPGDLPGDFGGMTAAMYAGLTASSSGFSFWGSDIGGYWSRNKKPPTKDVYLRWMQFAMLSPLTRAHGEVSPREPWNWDDETVAIYKYFAWLKMNLQPYLIDFARDSHETGEPLMRPLPLVYPHDKKSLAVDDEYLLGPDWLVAPVHAAGTARQLYLPAGRWYDAFANFKPVEGGQTAERSAPLSQLPLFGRAGSIIPLKLNAQWHLGESYTQGVESVFLLLPNPSTDPSVSNGLVMWRDGNDLLISAKSDLTFNLWIPSVSNHDIKVGNQTIEKSTSMPTAGPLMTAWYDAGGARICFRGRILPGLQVQIANYFAS